MSMLREHDLFPSYWSTRTHHLRTGFVHPPIDYEQELLESIRLADEHQALITLRKINEMDSATLAHYPLRSKKNSMIASCTLFTRAIIKAGVDPEKSFQLSDSLIRRIESTDDLDKLHRFEYEMVLQFIDMKKEQDELPFSHVVNISIHFIRAHIFKNLSLSQIALHANVHPSYLSDRFNRETGMSITEYINRCKVEESKPLLLHSNQSISEIAMMFMFCNQSYYTQLFKKYTGKTPKQFQRDGE